MFVEQPFTLFYVTCLGSQRLYIVIRCVKQNDNLSEETSSTFSFRFYLANSLPPTFGHMSYNPIPHKL